MGDFETGRAAVSILRDPAGFIRYPNDVSVERPEPAAGPAPESDWSRPGRIAARLARHVEVALAEIDLSLPQYRLLMILSEQVAVASSLAESLRVTRPSVTAVVDGLVARGLVERRACLDDRRRVEHVLTSEGRRLLDQADDKVDARLAAVAANAGEGRQAGEALEGLRRWRPALDSYWAGKWRVRA